MPLYYKGLPRGYDLDLELKFTTIDGQRVQLGSAGSIIHVCTTCGEEHFRESYWGPENCFQGHGPMILMPLNKDGDPVIEKLRAIWKAKGDRIIPVEERKARRLECEAKNPNWVFGDKTEADFPLGYVKDERKS